MSFVPYWKMPNAASEEEGQEREQPMSQPLEGVRSAVSLLGAEATEWFDETFGPAKPVEHVEVSQWGQVRPRPTRGLGGGKQRLETADPSIPAKISDAIRAAEAKAKAQADEMAAILAMAEKEKREAAEVFARRAQIFALEEAGTARRMSYFGRPAQQCRLTKIEFHKNRMRWENQAAMWQHLAFDAEQEIKVLKERLSEAKKLRSAAASKASLLRGREKGAAAAASGLSFASALDKDRLAATAEQLRLKTEAQGEEATAREQRWQQEVLEDLIAQEEEKQRAAKAQVTACKFKALENLEDGTQAEQAEIETVNGELALAEEFIKMNNKQAAQLAAGSPAWVNVMTQTEALFLKKELLNKEKRMFVPVQTDVFGEKAFEPVKMPVLALPGSAKVKGKQRNFKWSVKLQKEGQVILASGLGGPLTERAFVVDEADKVNRLNKALRDILEDSLQEEVVSKLSEKLEKLYGDDDITKRPPLKSLREELEVLGDNSIKVARRKEAKQAAKLLLKFYALEKGDPERDGGMVVGCREVSIGALRQQVQLYPDMFVSELSGLGLFEAREPKKDGMGQGKASEPKGSLENGHELLPMWQQGEERIVELRKKVLKFTDAHGGHCQVCGKLEAHHYSAENLFCYGGMTYRGNEPGEKEEYGKCMTCYRAKEEHFTAALFCHNLPPDKHHEVRPGPSSSVFVTLRHNPHGIFMAGWADPGIPQLMEGRDTSMFGALGLSGISSTTLPYSINLGYRRLPTVKVYVPNLHHEDALLPKPNITKPDRNLRVTGCITKWLKRPNDKVLCTPRMGSFPTTSEQLACDVSTLISLLQKVEPGDVVCILRVFDQRYEEKFNPLEHHYQVPEEEEGKTPDERSGAERKSATYWGVYEEYVPPSDAKKCKQSRFPLAVPGEDGCLRDGKQLQYKIWEMHVKVVASGVLTGICIGLPATGQKEPKPQEFKLSSFQEIAEIDVGEVGWKGHLLPLSEWPPP